jgi:Cd2+/Zn2+-exporting ATPase
LQATNLDRCRPASITEEDLNMTAPSDIVTAESPLKMRVEGMDCSACAIKIENALRRLPGVSDINVNFATETLSVRLDENRTRRDVVESKIRALGYTPQSLEPKGVQPLDGRGGPGRKTYDQGWWSTRKARLAVGLAGLLALAFALSLAVPEFSGYTDAVVGLVLRARSSAPLAGAASASK